MKRKCLHSVEVISPTNSPIEVMANDITAQIVKTAPDIKKEDLNDVENSVASIKVRAVKPVSGKKL